MPVRSARGGDFSGRQWREKRVTGAGTVPVFDGNEFQVWENGGDEMTSGNRIPPNRSISGSASCSGQLKEAGWRSIEPFRQERARSGKLSSMRLMRLGTVLVIALIVRAQAIDPRDRDFWNSKFNDPKTAFDRQPSQLLVDAIRGRTPGKALDLGMGQGRNAIYLAQQGWQATGVDLSDVAVSQAKAQAATLHVELTAVVNDVDRFEMGKAQWDLITLFYMHAWYHGSPSANAKRIVAALKPGGLVVIEGFAGPEKFMFQPNELVRDFSDLRILRYEDTREEAEWSPGSKSHIIRLVAEKSR